MQLIQKKIIKKLDNFLFWIYTIIVSYDTLRKGGDVIWRLTMKLSNF
jgi:hypothetical protein